MDAIASGALTVYRFMAMGGPASLQLPGPRTAQTDAMAQSAVDEVLRIEAKYSRYRADSLLSRINAGAGDRPLPCDEETFNLLRFADHLWHVTAGRFDATSGIYRRAWNFRSGLVPTPAQVEALRPLVDWRAVEWDTQGVRLSMAGMELDFGGFCKEYAADRAAGVLRAAGLAHALVELGGDVVAVGRRPDDNPWQIGVRHPREQGRLLATVPLDNCALATSGDYERFIETPSARYCHVLDAHTGWPVRHWQSVSVVAATCLAAGAATTSVMLMAAESRIAIEAGRLHGLFVDFNGTVV